MFYLLADLRDSKKSNDFFMTKRSGNLSRVGNRPLSASACAFCTLWWLATQRSMCLFWPRHDFWLDALAGMLPGNFHGLTAWGKEREREKRKEKKKKKFLLLLSFSEGHPYRKRSDSVSIYVFECLQGNMVVTSWRVSRQTPIPAHSETPSPGHVHRCSSVEPSHRDQKRCETIRETLLFVRDGSSLNVSQFFFWPIGQRKPEERLLIWGRNGVW